jgi:hypothetical protein
MAVARAGGLFLFAVPRRLHATVDGPPREEWFTGKAPEVLKSAPLVRPKRTVNVADAADRIETLYRIDLAKGLQVTLTGEKKWSGGQLLPGPAEDRPSIFRWYFAGGAAAVALIALVVVAWRRWFV